MQKVLTESEQSTLRTLQQNHPKSDIRKRAQIILLSHEGQSISAIAFTSSVDITTITSYLDNWEKYGVEGLLNDERRNRSLQQHLNMLRSNKIFEGLVISVILVSAVVVGIKTYALPRAMTSAIGVLDWAITIFFLFEIVVRFIGEERKRNFFTSAWNVFDTLIVLVSLIPIQDSELALLGRLIRIFRVLRMVSIIPELRLLINSLLRALPQLGYICLLIFIIFYIYAAVGTAFFAEINPVLWGDITVSLLTLFRVMTFEDWTDVMYETMEVHSWSWAFYLSFIFSTAFAFLNMVIGVIVKVLEDEQAKERAKSHGGEEEPDNYELKRQMMEIKEILQDKLK